MSNDASSYSANPSKASVKAYFSGVAATLVISAAINYLLNKIISPFYIHTHYPNLDDAIWIQSLACISGVLAGALVFVFLARHKKVAVAAMVLLSSPIIGWFSLVLLLAIACTFGSCL